MHNMKQRKELVSRAEACFTLAWCCVFLVAGLFRAQRFALSPQVQSRMPFILFGVATGISFIVYKLLPDRYFDNNPRRYNPNLNLWQVMMVLVMLVFVFICAISASMYVEKAFGKGTTDVWPAILAVSLLRIAERKGYWSWVVKFRRANPEELQSR